MKASETLSRRMLACGAVLGFVLALSGLVEWPSGSDAAAIVNGTEISRPEFVAHLDLLASDKSQPIQLEDVQHVMRRLIDEQLLLQRGLALNLPSVEPALRKQIVTAVAEQAVVSNALDAPDELTLRAFYREHIQYFQSRQGGGAPPFETIAAQVEREYRRRARDRALQRYLDDLYAQANVEVDEAFLAQVVADLERQ